MHIRKISVIVASMNVGPREAGYTAQQMVRFAMSRKPGILEARVAMFLARPYRREADRVLRERPVLGENGLPINDPKERLIAVGAFASRLAQEDIGAKIARVPGPLKGIGRRILRDMELIFFAPVIGSIEESNREETNSTEGQHALSPSLNEAARRAVRIHGAVSVRAHDYIAERRPRS